METLWFCIVAVMITAYVVFDGFDLGAGTIHLIVARTSSERAQVIASIGPVWDGNEVWLLAGGGTLYFAFPPLYAAAFSGFYLPLMMVLWLLILRGISIEFRNHMEGDLWKPLWDAVFCGSSGLLALLLGAALGNVVRGVPLDADGFFFLPLWTNFLPGSRPGVVDWYTLLTGAAGFAALAMHGSLWVAMKTNGDVRARSRKLADQSWLVLLVLTIAVTVASFLLQPHLGERFATHPGGYVFPAIAIAGFVCVFVFQRKRTELKAFLASCGYILGMLTSVVFGVYPYVLPSSTDPARSLSIYNAAAPRYGLEVGLWWFVPGMVLVTCYFVFAYSRHRGKVPVASS